MGRGYRASCPAASGMGEANLPPSAVEPAARYPGRLRV